MLDRPIIVAGSILEGSYNAIALAEAAAQIVAGSILEGSYNGYEIEGPDEENCSRFDFRG
tara:strand:+ start:551 stop:730 length:180 start_codon:yes stop_codon:yes gene_type:complete